MKFRPNDIILIDLEVNTLQVVRKVRGGGTRPLLTREKQDKKFIAQYKLTKANSKAVAEFLVLFSNYTVEVNKELTRGHIAAFTIIRKPKEEV